MADACVDSTHAQRTDADVLHEMASLCHKSAEQ